MDEGPGLVSILRQGDNLIASIHTALDDSEMVRFQRNLIEQIGQAATLFRIEDRSELDELGLEAADEVRAFDGAAA